MELSQGRAVQPAWSGLVLMVLLSGVPAALAQSTVQTIQPATTAAATWAAEAPSTSSSRTTAASEELPDSPGATLSGSRPGVQELFAAQQTDAPPLPPPAQGQTPQAQPTQRPVGTAAAPGFTTTGVAASQPAGVAIAPEKQRRARTIVIRVGAIIGAGVAVGTVVALTEATSSKPPGAH